MDETAGEGKRPSPVSSDRRGIRIRRAVAEDADAVARLFRRVRSEAMAYLPVLYTPDQERIFFRSVLARADVWLAQAGETTVLGFVVRSGRRIDHLYVDAAARDRGVGSLLLGMAMEGQGSLCLWVFQKNEGAVRFYRRHGFSEVARTDGLGNEEREPDILMRCEAPVRP